VLTSRKFGEVFEFRSSMHGPWLYVGGALLVAASIFLLFLLYLAARALRSLVRARRCRTFADLAAKKQREGDIPGSVSLYLKAEAAWSLNTWDGSRESWLKDLDRLGNIGSGLVRTLSREPGMAYSDFNATIREMREMLRDRNNFRMDGRRMLPDVAVRWNASIRRLNGFRIRLRQVCEPRKVGRL
jgi:hypothetical protein